MQNNGFSGRLGAFPPLNQLQQQSQQQSSNEQQQQQQPAAAPTTFPRLLSQQPLLQQQQHQQQRPRAPRQPPPPPPPASDLGRLIDRKSKKAGATGTKSRNWERKGRNLKIQKKRVDTKGNSGLSKKSNLRFFVFVFLLLTLLPIASFLTFPYHLQNKTRQPS